LTGHDIERVIVSKKRHTALSIAKAYHALISVMENSPYREKAAD
jgi:hypothetical protein